MSPKGGLTNFWIQICLKIWLSRYTHTHTHTHNVSIMTALNIDFPFLSSPHPPQIFTHTHTHGWWHQLPWENAGTFSLHFCNLSLLSCFLSSFWPSQHHHYNCSHIW